MSDGRFGRATIGETLQAVTRDLRRAGVPDAAGDARRLVAHALGIGPDRLTLVTGDRFPDDGRDTLLDLHVGKRMARRPLSQITGSRLFWGREFRVTPDVLDPRPETETLVAEALAGPFSRVLDLGTGSGCLLVTLLAERPLARGLGTDLSPGALEVARVNAASHHLDGRADFRLADWWDGVGESFDLIVANPPYIAAEEMPGLEPEVRDHEPRMALTDEGDGLAAFRAILRDARPHMAPGGRLLLEHGPTQAEAIAEIGRSHGFPEPEHRKDLDGRARVILLRAP